MKITHKKKATLTKSEKMVKKKHKKESALCKKECSSNWLQFISTSKVANSSLKVTCSKANKRVLQKYKKPSKVIALDCEMVADENGRDMLARVSLVDFNLNCIYDKYVKPSATVVDYRTRFSGIRPENIANGEDFEVVQKEVRSLLHNKFLVGHGLRNDLNVLQFGHHAKLIRDTSSYPLFREISNGKTPSLRKLAQHYLNETIQEGEHNSIVDATTAMKLYIQVRKQWEHHILSKKK